MRRLLAAAAVAAIGLSITIPLASAHYDDNPYSATGHVLAWQNMNNPSPATTADNGTAVLMDEVVAAYAKFNDGVKSWDVVIRPVNGGQPSTCHEDFAQNPKDRNSYPTEVYINCPWNTAMATNHTLPGPTPAEEAKKPVSSRVWQSQDLGPSVNGPYTVEITVWNAAQSCGLLTGCQVPDVNRQEPHCLADTGYAPCKPGDPVPQWRKLYVVNKPVPPGAVSSVFDPTTNSISVTWPANPEPDVSYLVQEKVGDGKWSSGVAVPANRYERPLDQPGKYQFQVAAVRPGPTRNNDRATERSAFTAAGPVDVSQLTPPSTAGGAPSGADGAPGGGGGDQGVFIPTDPTSPTPVTAGGKATPGKTTGKSPARPSGTTSRSRTTAHTPGEAEGEGPDYGFSTELPYNTSKGDPEFADDGLADEGEPEMLAGGVVPKPRDTRQLMIFMAGALTLFVFAMQITFMLRRSRPVAASTGAGAETYHDDFDDWLGF